MRTPRKSELNYGMRRYTNGERPWPERGRAVDWFIVTSSGEFYPLKYTFGLALDVRPSSYTTDQAKRWLKPLILAIVSLSTQFPDSPEFEKAVQASLKDGRGRAKRLATARRIPKQRLVVQKVFVRNADVVAEVRARANGKCEECRKDAPFKVAKGGWPYLEVHHRKTLASGGEDTVDNAIALCPNCHRRAHHG